MRTCLLGAAVWCLVAPLILVDLAESEESAGRNVEITVAYTVVATEVSPHNGTYRSAWSRTLRLSGRNAIQDVLTYNGTLVSAAQRTLGTSFQGVASANGLPVHNAIRIVQGAIVIPNEYETYTDVTTIKTDGRTSCSATMTFRLKPGHLRFETAEPVGHAAVVLSDLRAEDFTCSIRVPQE